jgi:hypothetical protein
MKNVSFHNLFLDNEGVVMKWEKHLYMNNNNVNQAQLICSTYKTN